MTFQTPRTVASGRVETAPAPEASPAANLLPPGILVVDDAAALRPVLSQFLQRRGFRVWDAGEFAEAIHLFERHRHDINLVLLEADLESGGPAILAQLRRINPSVRCCFMSNDPWLYDETELLALGAEWVFHKPFTPADVATVLWNIAGNARPRSDITTPVQVAQ